MTRARASLQNAVELVRTLSQAPEVPAFYGAWRFLPLIRSSGGRDPASAFPQRPNFSADSSVTQYLLHGKLCHFPFTFLLGTHPLRNTKLRTQGWESNKAVQIFPDVGGFSNVRASHVCVVSGANLRREPGPLATPPAQGQC